MAAQSDSKEEEEVSHTSDEGPIINANPYHNLVTQTQGGQVAARSASTPAKAPSASMPAQHVSPTIKDNLPMNTTMESQALISIGK
eukprot:8529884-Pyramimonas_sp.AAC.1